MTIYPSGGFRIDNTALFLCNRLRAAEGLAEVADLSEVPNPDQYRLLVREVLSVYRDGCIELEVAEEYRLPAQLP